MTTVYREAPSDGVAEADVELNALGFDWSLGAEPRRTEARPVVSLVPVLVHEIGHQLGFEDACGSRHDGSVHAGCGADELESVMVSGSGRAALSDFDVRRLCSRYPKNEAPSNKATERASQTVPSGWLTMLAFAILVGLLVRWLALRVWPRSR